MFVFAQDRLEKVEYFLDSISQESFNGNVLYSRNDSVLLKGSYGYSDFENQTLLNERSLFDLASVSKQFTAVAIIQLIEQGKLDYSTKAAEILKDLPYDQITIEHLLRHQSGLKDYMALLNKKWDKKNIATNKDIVISFAKYHPKLKFEPGSAYEYSNSGYALLASIVEAVSKEKFEDYLKKNILEPSGMSDSRIIRIKYKPTETANLATSYSFSKKEKKYVDVYANPKNEDFTWLNGVVGDGMIYSTILDLEKWKYALRSNLVISEKSKANMFSVDEVSTNYGYGIRCADNKLYGRTIYHTGTWAGYNNIMIYFPNTNEFYAILTNNSTKELEMVINNVLSLSH